MVFNIMCVVMIREAVFGVSFHRGIVNDNLSRAHYYTNSIDRKACVAY